MILETMIKFMGQVIRFDGRNALIAYYIDATERDSMYVSRQVLEANGIREGDNLICCSRWIQGTRIQSFTKLERHELTEEELAAIQQEVADLSDSI